MCGSRSFRADRIQLNFLRQTTASICEVFPAFRENISFPFGLCVWIYTAQTWTSSHQLRCYKTESTPWRWVWIYFPKRRKIFTSWLGCLPEKIALNTCLPLPPLYPAVKFEKFFVCGLERPKYFVSDFIIFGCDLHICCAAKDSWISWLLAGMWQL